MLASATVGRGTRNDGRGTRGRAVALFLALSHEVCFLSLEPGALSLLPWRETYFGSTRQRLHCARAMPRWGLSVEIHRRRPVVPVVPLSPLSPLTPLTPSHPVALVGLVGLVGNAAVLSS